MNDIYTFTIPVFVKTLGGLKNVLTKAEVFAKENNKSEAELLNDRLWPDMFPLVKQVQVACDQAKAGAARLSGTENPKMEDTEATFAELQARIDKTIAFIGSIPQESYAGAADVKVTMPYFPGKYLTGFDYAREYLIPNFFFHVTTAYGLVRKNGVPVGKGDFANGVNFRDLEESAS